MKYNANLDSLRGFAAVAVIGFHCHVLRCGWIGVQFFFVLSGFLITSILREERERRSSGAEFLSRFFVRRVLRLVPLYALFLVAIGAIYLATGYPDAFRPAAPYLFTYTLNLARMSPTFPNSMVFAHLRSLGVEWQFYLVWPFVVWFVAPAKLARLLVILAIAAPLIRAFHAAIVLGGTLPWHASVAAQAALGATIYNAPWAHLDAFAFGGLLSFPAIQAQLAKPVATWFVGGIAVVAGGLVLRAGLLRGELTFDTLGFPGQLPRYGESIWGFSILNAFSGVILARVIAGGRIARAVTEHRALHHVGKISYGIYVWHAPVVAAIDPWLMARPNRFDPVNLALVALAIAATIGLAHLSFTLWEQRFLRMKDRVAPRSGAKPAPAMV